MLFAGHRRDEDRDRATDQPAAENQPGPHQRHVGRRQGARPRRPELRRARVRRVGRDPHPDRPAALRAYPGPGCAATTTPAATAGPAAPRRGTRTPPNRTRRTGRWIGGPIRWAPRSSVPASGRRTRRRAGSSPRAAATSTAPPSDVKYAHTVNIARKLNRTVHTPVWTTTDDARANGKGICSHCWS